MDRPPRSIPQRATYVVRSRAEADAQNANCAVSTADADPPGTGRLSALVTDVVTDIIRLDHSKTQSASGLYTTVVGESENECPISSDM